MKNMFSINRFSDVEVVYSDDKGELFSSPSLVNYNPTSLTEQAGYKPPRIQVLDFLMAGERLIASQKASYYQSDIEPLYSKDGDVLLPSLLRSYNPLEAKKNIDHFNSKLDEYKNMVASRKLEDHKRRVEEQKLYKEYYEKNKGTVNNDGEKT